MAGIYFIIPNAGRRGYIGLDSNMTESFFPRLYDHVYAAYHLSRSYRGSEAGAIRSNIQNCEAVMNEQLCCNFRYFICLSNEQEYYGLPKEKYDLFAQIWTSTATEKEQSWAEVYYIYTYYNSYAALNEAWGGQGKFVLNTEGWDNLKIGKKKLSTIIKEINFSWFPTRNNREKGLMNQFLFPYKYLFQKIIDQYLNQKVAPVVRQTIIAAIKDKATWMVFKQSVKKKDTIGISIPWKEKWTKDLNEIYSVVQTAIEIKQCRSDYNIPPFTSLIDHIKKQIQQACVHVLKTVTEDFFTKAGSLNKQKTNAQKHFVVNLSTQNWGIKTLKDYPAWWPTMNQSSRQDVTNQIKQIIPNEIFPFLVKHAQGGLPGIQYKQLQLYLQNVIEKLASSDRFLDDFYIPCRNYWLDATEGPLQIIDQKDDRITFRRSGWPELVSKTYSSEYLEQDISIEELTLW